MPVVFVRIFFGWISSRFKIKRNKFAVRSNHEIINCSGHHHIEFRKFSADSSSAEVKLAPLVKLFWVIKKFSLRFSLNFRREFFSRSEFIKILFEYIIHAIRKRRKCSARTLLVFIKM